MGIPLCYFYILFIIPTGLDATTSALDLHQCPNTTHTFFSTCCYKLQMAFVVFMPWWKPFSFMRCLSKATAAISSYPLPFLRSLSEWLKDLNPLRSKYVIQLVDVPLSEDYNHCRCQGYAISFLFTTVMTLLTQVITSYRPPTFITLSLSTHFQRHLIPILFMITLLVHGDSLSYKPQGRPSLFTVVPLLY